MAEQTRAPDRAVEAGRGGIFLGAAKIFFIVSGFVQQMLLPRLLGAGGYGTYSFVVAAVSVLNNATVQGTINSVSKFTSEDDSRADAVKAAGLKLQLAVGGALGLVFFLAGPLVAWHYKNPEFKSLFRIVALIPLLYSIYSVFVGSANGLRRFRAQAGFDMSFSAAKTVLVLGGAIAAGAAGALAGWATTSLLILGLSAVVMRLPRRDRIAAPFPMKRLLAFMGGIVLYTLLINLALNLDILLLRWFAALGAAAAHANELTGQYQGVRTFALLPYQLCLAITFVIFPLVSRSTFEQNRDATRAYVTQTLRYALIVAGAMAAVLVARPAGLLTLVYPAVFRDGAGALPVLVAGNVCLSLLGVSGSIINASGRLRASILLTALTVVSGTAAAFVLVPGQRPGPAMLTAAASATSFGTAVGLVTALVYLRRRFGAVAPLTTVLRVAAAVTAAVVVARLVPGQGKLLTVLVLPFAGVIFLGVLILLREFGAEDRAKFARIVGRRR
jgi:stage V sporulation protein B